MNVSENPKILWVNPSFLDYRVPLYGELNQKLNGHFHLLYSKRRVPDRCHLKTLQLLGANAHFLPTEPRFVIGREDSHFANSFVSIPLPKGLYRMIKEVNPDALIAEGFFQFTPYAVWYSLVHHKPLYIAYERTAHTERNCSWWRKMYRRFIGCFVNGYIANGVLTKEYLISQGVRAEKIFTGGMCADSEHLRVSTESMSSVEKQEFAASVQLGVCKGIRYVYVGQMIDRKGVKYLLDAWRKHSESYPDDELLLVGDGPLLAQFRQEYAALASVKFMGGVDYSIIYKYYAISDVFVIPTLEDNWSLVVPEAMACGLPVACSVYNGCHPELVKRDYNGCTFDPLSEASTLEALGYFHTVDLKQFGHNSAELERGFNPSATADNVLKMLNL